MNNLIQVSIQTDKKEPKRFNIDENFGNSMPPLIPQTNFQDENEKDRKIKKLTAFNKQLIEALKQQNEQLSKKIKKQKLSVGRRSSSSAVSPTKQSERTKRQLVNVYKQIEMYKNVLQTMRAKQISVDSLDKIRQLQNKIKIEDNTIDNLQKQIKFQRALQQEQTKNIELIKSDDNIKLVGQLQEEIVKLKQKLKNLKKIHIKHEQIQKKQQIYQIQLEKAYRKQNKDYFPGQSNKLTERSRVQTEYASDITEKQWEITKSEAIKLKKNYQENNKKMDILNRNKIKQIKSTEETDLILKQKSRKLNNLKNKIQQLAKLVVVRDSLKQLPKGLQQQLPIGHQYITDANGNMIKRVVDKSGLKNSPGSQERQVKRWVIPDGYCLQKGKILPDSVFFSDKVLLKDSKKTKIIKIKTWIDGNKSPNLFQFYYRDMQGKIIEGHQPYENIPQFLQQQIWQAKEGDYLYKVHGVFQNSFLKAITFQSKFGHSVTYQHQAGSNDGIQFKFDPRPTETPSCFFGAYVQEKNNGKIQLCHIGSQFISDW